MGKYRSHKQRALKYRVSLTARKNSLRAFKKSAKALQKREFEVEFFEFTGLPLKIKV